MLVVPPTSSRTLHRKRQSTITAYQGTPTPTLQTAQNSRTPPAPHATLVQQKRPQNKITIARTQRLALTPASTSNAFTTFSARVTPHHAHDRATHNVLAHPAQLLPLRSSLPSLSASPLCAVPDDGSVAAKASASDAAELLFVGHHGDINRHGFVQRDGTVGVVTWATTASLCPIRFHARSLRGQGK